MQKQICASFGKWRQDAILENDMFQICASFGDFVAVATHFIENHGGRRKNCKSKFVLVLKNGVKTQIKGKNLARIYSFFAWYPNFPGF